MNKYNLPKDVACTIEQLPLYWVLYTLGTTTYNSADGLTIHIKFANTTYELSLIEICNKKFLLDTIREIEED